MSQPGPLTNLTGDVAELAERLSIAVRIEPELIRTVRVKLLPKLDVSTEADLWFSDAVATRSADSIILRPDVSLFLQQRLARRLAEDANQQDPAWHVWDLLEKLHINSSPALRLEEYVAWLTVLPGEWDHIDRIDEALRPALHALTHEGRTGVIDWFARAWRRLPDPARRALTSWQLAQAVNGGNLRMKIADVPTPVNLGIYDVAAVASAVDDVVLQINRDGSEMLLGPRTLLGTPSIPVPDTDPQVVIVSWVVEDGVTETPLRLRRGERTRLTVGSGLVWLRNARGAVYEVAPPEETDLKRRDPPPTVYLSYAFDSSQHYELVQRLWRFLRAHGINVVIGLPLYDGRSRVQWIKQRIEKADYVLVVPPFRSIDTLAGGEPTPRIGSDLVEDLLRQDGLSWRGRVFLILLPGDTTDALPPNLRGVAVHRVTEFTDEGAESLLRALAQKPLRLWEDVLHPQYMQELQRVATPYRPPESFHFSLPRELAQSYNYRILQSDSVGGPDQRIKTGVLRMVDGMPFLYRFAELPVVTERGL